jgi:hypothetical protein
LSKYLGVAAHTRTADLRGHCVLHAPHQGSTDQAVLEPVGCVP